MAEVCIILLQLEGALQSWGEHSRFDYRDSAALPTKSAIVGMIGCAMGLRRGDEDLERISQNIRLAVRCDRPGKMYIDYHTVTAERKILNAAGNPRCDTIVTHRTYLQDAAFLVAVQTDPELAEKIVRAFQAPRWLIYLGRKCCIPSVPVFKRMAEEYHSLEEAMISEPLLDSCRKRSLGPEKVFYEVDSMDGSGYDRTDELINAKKRCFAPRKVKLVCKEEPHVSE